MFNTVMLYKPRNLLYPTIVVCMTLFGHNAFAAKWAMTPYSVIHAGVRFKTDWNKHWYLESEDKSITFEKISLTGTPLFIGIGALLNPMLLDGWHVSVEGIYQTYKQWEETTISSLGEQGLFISAKVAFPQSEGVDYFIGAGVGGFFSKELPIVKKKKAIELNLSESSEVKEAIEDNKENSDKGDNSSQLSWFDKTSTAAILYAGGNWHINNGWYFSMRGTHTFPMAEGTTQNFSLTLGLHWNWI